MLENTYKSDLNFEQIMPQHAPPKTLKNLAFENIIKHVDSVWTSQYVKDWGNKHLLYVEGPFDILTPAGELLTVSTYK